MPCATGLCGSSCVSHLAWCLRWIATHSFVTMPVVSQSQKRKKCDGMACSSSARCACARCRKMVTAAMVMWVSTRLISTICHQVVCTRPWAAQSIRPSRRVRNSVIEKSQSVGATQLSIVGDGPSADGRCSRRRSGELADRPRLPGGSASSLGSSEGAPLKLAPRPPRRSRRSRAGAATGAGSRPAPALPASATCARRSASAAGSTRKPGAWDAVNSCAMASFSACSRLQVA